VLSINPVASKRYGYSTARIIGVGENKKRSLGQYLEVGAFTGGKTEAIAVPINYWLG